jgi:hypothetical protein
MYNWSKTDFDKIEQPELREIKKLEQSINFGLNGQKISEKKLRRYFGQLQIDPLRKKFLSFLLWNSTDLPKTKRQR